MWDNVVGWGVVLLAAAISGGLLSRGLSRQVRQLKEQAELLAELPPGEAKSRIEVAVNHGAERLAHRLEAAERRRPGELTAASIYLAFFGLLAAGACRTVEAVWDGPGASVFGKAAVVFGLISLAVTSGQFLIALVWFVRELRAMERSRRRQLARERAREPVSLRELT